MTSSINVPSCKVEVRKYALVCNPSRWNQRGDRVVVQCPVSVDLNSSTSPSQVPVKRFTGEEDNSVCFIPSKDVERENSSIYETQQISRKTSWVDAHGVAIFDNEAGEELEYRRGDQFWLCVGPSTEKYQTTVPVINLRSKEGGEIGIDRVCWYPKIQGPNQELWTLGGPVRTLKLNGSKKFSLWSWVVSQQEGAPSKTMNAEIPAKDVVMPDRRLLSTSDRRALFEKKYLSMTNTTSKKTFQSPLHSDEGSTGLMTPPSSPDSDTQHTAVVIGEGPVPDLQAETTKPSHISLRMQALRRTVDIGSRTGRPWVMPSYSFIHPYCTSQSNTSKTSSPNSTEDLLINDDLSSVSTLETIQLSPSSSSPRVLPYSREISRMDGADLDGSISFLEFMRECAEQNDATSLSDLEMPSLTPLITGSSAICPGKCGDDNCLGLCDIDTTKCRYSEIFPTKHYHSPPDKCRCLPEMPHEHCISQTRALPGPAGNCLLLASLRTPDHVCCIWSAADRESWPPLGREYDRRKLEEARLYRANLYDLGRKVKSNPSVGQMPPRLVLREDLDEAGKMLLDDC